MISLCLCFCTLPGSGMQKDLAFMRLAVDQARQALDSSEVPVGCVFVRDGEVIGAGHNDTNRSHNSTRHAEFCAIDQILKTRPLSDFSASDLYVTVEPCIMCASALRQINVRRVFFGAGNERFGGCGSVLAINQDGPQESLGQPYPVYPNLMRREAVMLLREFYTRENPTAPSQLKAIKRQRVVKHDIPPIDFRLYMTRNEFAEYYGVKNLAEYDSGCCVVEF